jgi:hypothetical protein
MTATQLENAIPSAKDCLQKLAVAQAEEAAREAKQRARAEAEKRSLIEHLRSPSGVSEQEGINRAIAIIERALNQGRSEVQVHRFPCSLCTDKGRAINQQEPGWEKTLAGVPREIYDLWAKHFRDRGFKLRVEIVDFPGGFPGDVAMTLSWA